MWMHGELLDDDSIPTRESACRELDRLANALKGVEDALRTDPVGLTAKGQRLRLWHIEKGVSALSWPFEDVARARRKRLSDAARDLLADTYGQDPFACGDLLTRAADAAATAADIAKALTAVETLRVAIPRAMPAERISGRDTKAKIKREFVIRVFRIARKYGMDSFTTSIDVAHSSGVKPSPAIELVRTAGRLAEVRQSLEAWKDTVVLVLDEYPEFRKQ